MDKTIKLYDGRTLGYAEYGDPAGPPVFVFHGWPGSRLSAGLVQEDATRAGIRVIGVDRPGMGLSDFQAQRQFLDWPDDVVELADALEIDRFAVVGASGGGPYAIACAYRIPDRLTTCGIIAGMGPVGLSTEGMRADSRLLFAIGRRLPWLLGPLLWFSLGRHSQDKERAEELIAKMIPRLPAPDQEVYGNPELGGLLFGDLREAFRQGNQGPAYEGRLYARPWGFRLEDVAHDRVYLWHGELDTNVPVSMGRAMAAAIPHCQAKFYPDEAHVSIIINHMDEIAAALGS